MQSSSISSKKKKIIIILNRTFYWPFVESCVFFSVLFPLLFLVRNLTIIVSLLRQGADCKIHLIECDMYEQIHQRRSSFSNRTGSSSHSRISSTWIWLRTLLWPKWSKQSLIKFTIFTTSFNYSRRHVVKEYNSACGETRCCCVPANPWIHAMLCTTTSTYYYYVYTPDIRIHLIQFVQCSSFV